MVAAEGEVDDGGISVDLFPCGVVGVAAHATMELRVAVQVAAHEQSAQYAALVVVLKPTPATHGAHSLFLITLPGTEM